MENNLVLYNGPTSPFGRKCKIASLVLGIRHKEEIINVYKDLNWEDMSISEKSKHAIWAKKQTEEINNEKHF